MIYNYMDSELIKIYEIKNMELIKFYDLTLSNNNKQIIVPGLLIFYDKGKFLNLSIKDKYFEVYVNKVIEVYKEEKDKIVDDNSFFYHKLNVDLYSQKILDNCDILKKNKITEFYQEMDSFGSSLPFECDEIKNILDIIYYEIKSFGKFSNLTIDLTNNINGYRTNYSLECKINDIFTYLLIHYDRIDDNNYLVSIGNLGRINKTLNIHISFKDDQINITSKFNDILFDDIFKNFHYDIVK